MAHRLDEVVKAPYMEGAVKMEANTVKVKEEPRDNHKSRPSADKSSKDKHRLERGSKRDRTPENDEDDKIKKRHKHSQGNVEPDLTRVKKEKLDSEGKTKVKKEPEETSRSHERSKQDCDNPTKDRGRDSSSKHSSHGSGKQDRHKHSKRSEGSQDKHKQDSSKSSSSNSTANIFDKMKVKSEPLEKETASQSSSSMSSHDKVKVKKEHLDKGSDDDFHKVKVKSEPSDSSKKSRKHEDPSHSKKQSSSHHRSQDKSISSNGRTSDKGGSRNKDKSSSKSSESKPKKHEERTKTSGSSKSSSSAKKKKPVVAEFDMFSMPNGNDDSEDESENAGVDDVPNETPSTSKKNKLPSGVKVKTEPDQSKAGPSKKMSSAPRRLEAKLPGGSVPKPRQPVMGILIVQGGSQVWIVVHQFTSFLQPESVCGIMYPEPPLFEWLIDFTICNCITIYM